MTHTAKHTPGPWRLQVNRVKDYASVFPIQVCIEESPLSDETIANAHLIAAAPAMYEALYKLMLEAIHYRNTGGGEQFLTLAIEQAQKALAQAEGR